MEIGKIANTVKQIGKSKAYLQAYEHFKERFDGNPLFRENFFDDPHDHYFTEFNRDLRAIWKVGKNLEPAKVVSLGHGLFTYRYDVKDIDGAIVLSSGELDSYMEFARFGSEQKMLGGFNGFGNMSGFNIAYVDNDSPHLSDHIILFYSYKPFPGFSVLKEQQAKDMIERNYKYKGVPDKYSAPNGAVGVDALSAMCTETKSYEQQVDLIIQILTKFDIDTATEQEQAVMYELRDKAVNIMRDELMKSRLRQDRVLGKTEDKKYDLADVYAQVVADTDKKSLTEMLSYCEDEKDKIEVNIEMIKKKQEKEKQKREELIREKEEKKQQKEQKQQAKMDKQIQEKDRKNELKKQQAEAKKEKAEVERKMKEKRELRENYKI